MPPSHPPGDATLKQLCDEWSLHGGSGAVGWAPYSADEWELWNRCRDSRQQREHPATALERLRTKPWDEYPYSEVQRKTTTVRMSNFQRWISTVSEASIELLADDNIPTKRAKRLKNDWQAMNDKRFFVGFEDPEALGWLQSMRILFFV